MQRIKNERGNGERPARIAAVVRLAGDEPRVGAALQSVAWADEQLAVDLGTNEGAIRECADQGAELVEPGEVSAETTRREVDWVLLIEGHEEIPPALAGEIRAAARAQGSEASPVAYGIRRRVRFFGRTLRSRAWTTRRLVRLARRDAVSWQEGVLGTDSLRVQGRVGYLETPLVAAPGVTLRQYVSRMNALTDAAARAQHGVREPVRLRDLIVGPTAHGLRTLPEALVRDGVAGIILAVLEEYSIAVTCAKRWELEHPEKYRAGM